MAENLTPQQLSAVTDRGGNLLVSAAAGSGKTKVLVDRLMSFLTDPVNPAELDEFLIITYTKAAATELRGKIAAKLSQRIAEEPGNRHLRRQMQKLYLTKISTVHAFCADILREYAYRLDLSADFRVAEETECQQMQQQVLEELLEAAYEKAAENPDIQVFLDSQGLGRDDHLVPDILLSVYHSARCHLDPEEWLRWCVRSADPENLTDASQTVWGQHLIRDLHRYLDLQIEAMEQCAAAAGAAEGMEKPAALLRDTVSQLTRLRGCETWDAISEHRALDFGRLTFGKKAADPELQARIKAVREACKTGVNKKLRQFADRSEQILRDLQAVGGAARGLASLVQAFTEGYEQCKRRRRVLDFEDLEQKTLELLLGKSRTGFTGAAAEIGSRYREVMVDEYQDSNQVQDAIFEALTRQKKNCFMVGDVKQSIYQFRLADPGIFLEKYNTFAPEEKAEPGQGRKVLLSHNFRSSGGILSAVNDVFSVCMSPAVGGLAYTEDEALREGLPHTPLGEPEVELYALQTEEDAYAEEADFAARRICELLSGSHCVRQGDVLRPIKPEDIVILLRSPGSVGADFQQALEKRGVRCSFGGDTDLLRTQEVTALRSLLQIINNPLQDIPLVAVLSSPVFGFTADDLAAIRAENLSGNLYTALQKDGCENSRRFLELLNRLRKQARLLTLTQLLELVLSLTRLDSIYGAMSDGERRTENLQAFCQTAADYEAGGNKDLDSFLVHLEAIEEKGLILSREPVAGAVTIMSIHKSKGLEFPVVFLCGLSRQFNREAARAQVLCDKELGLGLSCVDLKNRVRYPSISKRAIAVKTASDSLSEELRVLYVAMTRARDRLIMTYADKYLGSTLNDLSLRMDMSSRELMACQVSDPGQWVLLTALRRTEAGELFKLGGQPIQTESSEPAWEIHTAETAKTEEALREQAALQRPEPDEKTIRKLSESLSFTYAHSLAVQTPSKMTATQLKGRLKDQESASGAPEQQPVSRQWRKPAFAGKELRGKEYGNALHAAMQYICYGACKDLSGVTQEIRRLERDGFLSPEQARIVNCRQIAAFFATDLGKTLQESENVLREFKFSILDDGSRYSPGMGDEKVLLQGVVDCAILDAEGITVVDFKTDYVTEETLEATAGRYRTQVQVYADALARIYQKPIKEKLLYFFHLGRFVSLS